MPAQPLASSQRRPAIVFLHGSLGNFKGYYWTWKAFADRHDCVIVGPTFGKGNWDQPGARDAIERGLDICRSIPGVDPSRIHLAGLSAGGMGALRAMEAHGEAFRGVILISPVIDPNRAVHAFRQKPVIVISGENDNRIPETFLLSTAS